MLLEELRKRNFRYKFRQHHPIGPFVVELYCPELRLIIEIIDQTLDSESEKEVWLISHGYTLLHFTQAEVSHEQDRVVDRLFHVCLHLSLPV